MQYITQLALAARARNPTAPLAGENNFTFYPRFLKSSRYDASDEEAPINRACARLIAGSWVSKMLVEPIGIEPMTSCLQSRRSPS